ncbi:MAG: hypothetical protein WDN28_22395 [Chthoniobacter sp.]
MNGIGARNRHGLGTRVAHCLARHRHLGAAGRWLTAQRGRSRICAWVLLLAPFFTPPLLVSYSLAKVALIGHEALYIGVLALKLIPVAVVLRALLPSPLSAEGRHVFSDARPGGWVASRPISPARCRP